MPRLPRPRVRARRIAAATLLATGVPLAAAYRFALVYRRRAGFPERRLPIGTPSDVGLDWEPVTVDSPAGPLPAWLVLARGGAPGPGVVLVHGWESNRARMLPNARFLVGAGLHCLMFDVRGHGENPAELHPISAAEFAADTSAAVTALAARPEVTTIALLGHSIGAAGAIIAAADDARVGAVVSTSAPAEPRRMTRQTFRLAGLPIPGPVAVPLAEVTARAYLRPRGHALAAASALAAARRYGGPLLLVHGSEDEAVPLADMRLLERAARGARGGSRGRGATPSSDHGVETLVIMGGHHRWLYEFPEYRRVIAAFLARALGGPLDPERAGAIAAGVAVERPADTEGPFAALLGDRPVSVVGTRPAGAVPDPDGS